MWKRLPRGKMNPCQMGTGASGGTRLSKSETSRVSPAGPTQLAVSRKHPFLGVHDLGPYVTLTFLKRAKHLATSCKT